MNSHVWETVFSALLAARRCTWNASRAVRVPRIRSDGEERPSVP